MKDELTSTVVTITSMFQTKLLYVLIVMGGALSDVIALFITEKYQFISIVAVLFLDLIFGVTRAIKYNEFETKKSFKIVWMLFAYTGLLATVLLIEKGFPFAAFLSEAVLLPIIVFQIISILKNMSLLGLISNSVLNKILKNIDLHKNTEDNTIT